MHPSKLRRQITSEKKSDQKRQAYMYSLFLTKQSEITHMFSSIIKFPLIEIKKVGAGTK